MNAVLCYSSSFVRSGTDSRRNRRSLQCVDHARLVASRSSLYRCYMSRSVSSPRSFPLATSAWSAVSILLLAHVVIDAFANAVPAVIGLLESRCHLSHAETAWLTGFGALVSGIAQPIFAWLSDRWNTRAFAATGLVVTLIGFGSFGIARDAVTLFTVFGIGMIGVGMFHPIAASSIGHAMPQRRALLVSLFFVCGMAGSVVGAMIAPRLLATDDGFAKLPWVIFPGLVVAACVQMVVGPREHRDSQPVSASAPSTAAAHWMPFGFLYVSSVLRFAVNLSLFYLYLRLLTDQMAAENPSVAADYLAQQVAPRQGTMVACTSGGMALGGLLAGVFVRTGRERLPLVLVPIVLSPAIVAMPYASVPLLYLLATLAGIGFASTIPVSIAVAQRLLPGYTSVASGMMMGGAWALAMAGPPTAELLLKANGLADTFHVTAATLVASGLVCLLIPARDFDCR